MAWPLSRAPNILITATAPVTPGLITNTAEIASEILAPDLLNKSATMTMTLVDHADLRLVKTVQPGRVMPHAMLTYSLQITNLGPGSATAISVNDVASNVTGLGEADVTRGVGWLCARDGNAFTCTVATLAVGESATIVVTATAPSSAGTITNTAVVTSELIDFAPINNSALVTATVSNVLYLALVARNHTTVSGLWNLAGFPRVLAQLWIV